MQNKAGLDSFWLKVIAIISMTVDHIGYVFFPQMQIFRIIGRIALPIFAFLIAEGYSHTKNVRKYELRLFLFALISALPFYLVFGKWENVFFTLLGGLLSLDIADKVKNKWAGILCMLIIAALTYPCDWGFVGVVTVFAFAKIKDKSFAAIFGVIVAIFLYLAKRYFADVILGGSVFVFDRYTLIFAMLLSLPFIMAYNGKQGYKIKHIFYVYYPLHLAVIWLIDFVSTNIK